MTVSIDNSPRNLSFSNNPVVYKLTLRDELGVPLVSKLADSVFKYNNDAFQDGDVVAISITDEDNQLVALVQFQLISTAPTNTNEIQVNFANIDQDEMQHIIDSINAHYRLNPYIFCYQDNLGIHAQLIVSDNYTIEWIFNPQKAFTKSFTPFMSADTEGATYAVFFEKRYNTNVFAEAFKGELVADDNAKIALNISDVLQSECLTTLLENPFAHYPIDDAIVSNNIRRYYCRFVKTYDAVRFLMIGGYSNRRFLVQDFFNSLGNSNSFLTYQPNQKSVAFQSKEWLSWFCYAGDGEVYLKVRRWKAGLSDYFEKQYVTAVNGLCVTFSVSPAALVLHAQTTHYTVQIFKGNVPVSPLRTYIHDRFFYRFRQLAYLNAFGLPETITCRGNFSHTIAISAEAYQIIRNTEGGSQTIVNKRLKDNVQHKYTYRTGYLSASEKEAYSEVLASNVLYDVTDTNYFALQIADSRSKDELVSETGEYLYTWEFVCIPIIQESNFETDAVTKSMANPAEPPAFPNGLVNNLGGIQSGLLIFEMTQAEFDALQAQGTLNEGIYRITDNENVYLSGGGSLAINIKYGPLRFAKALNITSGSILIADISATTANDRLRMRVYRGNVEIFEIDDFIIDNLNQIIFTIPLNMEDIRIFY
jgi:hypothetical protein